MLGLTSASKPGAWASPGPDPAPFGGLGAFNLIAPERCNRIPLRGTISASFAGSPLGFQPHRRAGADAPHGPRVRRAGNRPALPAAGREAGIPARPDATA